MRELRHVVERALVLAGGDLIRPSDLPPELLRGAAPAAPARFLGRSCHRSAGPLPLDAAPCTCYVHAMVRVLKHKHLKLDQRKIDFAKRYFGVDSEQEAIDRALALIMEEEQIVKGLAPLAGVLRGDDRPWPYL